MRQSVRWGVWVSLCAGAAGAWAASDGALYQCPRNLFTNQIDEAQAKAQACTRVLPGRLTQAAVPAVPTVQPAHSVVPEAAVSSESASAAASAPPVAAPAALPTAAAAPPQQPRLAASAALPVAPAAAPVPVPVPVPLLPAAVQRVSSAQQRGRDQDAQSILRAELTRTQAAQLAAQRTGAGAPSAVQTAALMRLREDEAALLRELARFRP